MIISSYDEFEIDPLYEMDDEEREAYAAHQDWLDMCRSIPDAAERNPNLR